MSALPVADARETEAMLADAAALVTAEDYPGAIRLLERACADNDSVQLAQRLIDLRIEAFAHMDRSAPAIDWPPVHDNRYQHCSEFPEIAADELDAEALKAGIIGQGGLIVRGLMPTQQVAEMRDRVDHALRARMKYATGSADQASIGWFNRSDLVRGGPVQFDKGDADRFSNTGSLWSADSPLAAAALTRFYHEIGLDRMLAEYFHEPAVLSVRKWLMRCIAPNNGLQAGWHQDGRFLGDPSIRTVNLWVALSDCGEGMSAPGMELVGGPGGTIYDTGTAGADFDWTVSQAVVDDVARTYPTQVPTFGAGDAIFFDHFNLHRTAFGTDHSCNRYALESWFFAASTAPAKQQPLVF